MPGAPRDPHALPLNKVHALVQDFQWDGANKDRLVKRWVDEIGSLRK
jgi:hypothetical protein